MKHLLANTIKKKYKNTKKTEQKEDTESLLIEKHLLISTTGPVKMNFTPDTYFNGDISSLLGKMEEQAISRESYTFPLCYSALNSVTSEKWNTTAKKPVNETVSHRQQYSYSSADKHHCVCVVCVLLCRSSKAAVLLFAVPSLQLNAPQDLLFQHNSIAFKQGKKKKQRPPH